MVLVQLMSTIIAKFDTIVEHHGVYKRVRHSFANDDFYMVASGVPIRTPYHAEYACDVALEFLQIIRTIREETTGRGVEIKIGK